MPVMDTMVSMLPSASRAYSRAPGCEPSWRCHCLRNFQRLAALTSPTTIRSGRMPQLLRSSFALRDVAFCFDIGRSRPRVARRAVAGIW